MATDAKISSWLQIKIWHLLVIFVCCAVFAVWLMQWVEHSRKQTKVVAMFDSRIRFRHQVDEHGGYSESSIATSPPGPILFRYFLGDNLFATLVDLEICSPHDQATESIEIVGQLPHLKRLKVVGCPKLKRFDGLENLKELETLHVADCSQVVDYSSLLQIHGLKNVHLENCKNLDRLPVENCRDLKILWLDGASHLDLSAIESLPQLSSLYLSEIGSIDLQTAKSNQVSSLGIRYCETLAGLSGISKFRFLKRLDLTGCFQLQSIIELAQLHDLKSISLANCKKLSGFSGLKELTGLQRIDLSYCDGLKDLNWTRKLENLKHLNLSGCRNVQDWTALKELTELQTIDLCCCEGIDWAVLKHLTNLKSLNVIGCSSINQQDVDALQELLPDAEIQTFFE